MLNKIMLKSSDGKFVETDIQIVKCSGTITAILESGMENEENKVVSVPNVKSEILSKVLSWAEYHKDDPQPMKEVRFADIIPWDADFLKVDQSTLLDITMAANYLKIQGLQCLTCQMLANMVRGKSLEEMRKIFGLKDEED